MKTEFYSDIEDLCLDIAQKYHDYSQKDEFYGVSILIFYDTIITEKEYKGEGYF